MSDYGDEFEARGRRKATELLARSHPALALAQYPAVHDIVTLAYMTGYRDGAKDTTDEFRAVMEATDAGS